MTRLFKPSRAATAVCACLSIVTLAACGGTSTPMDMEGTPRQASFTTFAEGFALANQINNRAEAASLLTDANRIAGGSAIYRGVIGLDTENPERLIGAINLDVSFEGAGSITGGADNFFGAGGGSYSGTLALSDGVVRLTDLPVLQFNLNGALTADGVDGINYDLVVETAFFGENGELLSGDVTGQGTDGVVTFMVDGLVVGERELGQVLGVQ